jgi:hypothetical protein
MYSEHFEKYSVVWYGVTLNAAALATVTRSELEGGSPFLTFTI